MKKFIQKSVALFIVALAFVSIIPNSAKAARPQFAKTEALQMAMVAYSGSGALSSLRLEKEGSKAIYSVEFTEEDKKVDVRINAVTGETDDVVETELEPGYEPSEGDLNSVIEVLSSLISSLQEILN